nr:acyltransferase [uncultured bacterium]
MLAPSERIHAAKEAYIGYTVRAEGRLDPEALTTAFEAVSRAYPQLSARVEFTGDGAVLTEAEDPSARRRSASPTATSSALSPGWTSTRAGR